MQTFVAVVAAVVCMSLIWRLIAWQANRWRPTGYELQPVEVERVRYEHGRVRGSIVLDNLNKGLGVRARDIHLVVFNVSDGSRLADLKLEEMFVGCGVQSPEVNLSHIFPTLSGAVARGELTVFCYFTSGTLGYGIIPRKVRNPGQIPFDSPLFMRRRN